MEESENNKQNKESKRHYPSGEIEIYSSFKEENEATAKYYAQKSCLEYFQIANSLITKIYRDELQNVDQPYSNITFIKYGIPD